MMNKLLFASMFLILFCSVAFAQKNVSGKVKDAGSGRHIPGASIKIGSGASELATSDWKGNFSLSIQDDTARLIFSAEGYKTQPVIVSDTSVIVELSPQRYSLSDAVVVSGDQLTEFSDFDLITLLKGRIPGMYVKTWDATPGSGSLANIRGAISGIYGNGMPLVLINGMPVGNSVDGMTGISDLAAINVENIAKVEVLKSITAQSLYGSRGANGVIYITTKDGTGQPSVTIKGSGGVNFVPELQKVLSGNDERYRVKGLIDNINALYPGNQQANYPGFIVDSLNSFYHHANDWQKEMYELSTYQNHALKLAGSGMYGSYWLSLDALLAESAKKETGFNRYSINANTRFNVTEKFFFNLYTNIVLTSKSSSPFRLPRPSYVPFHNNKDYFTKLSFISDDKYIAENENNYINSNVSFNYKISDRTSVNSVFGLFYRSVRKDYYLPSTILGYGGGRPVAYSNKTMNMTNKTELNYRLKNGVGNLDLTLGGEFIINDSEYVGASSFPVREDDISDFVQIVSGGRQFTNAESYKDKSKLASGYFSANYSLFEKYRITGSLRADGTSKFVKDKTNFYPSLGLEWLINKEIFLAENGSFTGMSLYAGIGKVGLLPQNSYLSYGKMIADGRYVYDGARVVYPYSPWLKPLDVMQVDVGFDFELFDVVNVRARWYKKELKNMITYYNQPLLGGYDYLLDSKDKGEATGYEVSLEANMINNEKIHWNSSISLSTYETTKNENGVQRSVTAIQAYSAAGYHDSNVPVNSNTGLPVSVGKVYFSEGTPKILDLNNDGEINERDRMVIADPTPDFYGAFINSLQWSRFSLDLVIDYSWGGDVVRESQSNRFDHFSNIESYLSRAMFRGISKSTNYYFIGQSGDGVYMQGIASIEDASYVRLGQVRLSYDFGTKRSYRVFASANNLYTLSDYSGLNPDETVNGINDFKMQTTGLPLYRTVVLGFKVNF